MSKKTKVKFPEKYDQGKAVKEMQDRAWRLIEGCTREEYFDKVKEELQQGTTRSEIQNEKRL